MRHRYRAHGLVIASAVTLPLQRDPEPGGPDPARGEPDLALRRGADRQVPTAVPSGCVLATLSRPDGALLYVLSCDRDRAVLRYPGLCDFVGDAGLSDVTVHLHPGADPHLVPVLAAGALIAVHLRLRDELVLHASAVRVDRGALAFVGRSGMGKSTLAALLCREGHELVSDDVLRVDLTDPDLVGVHPGSTENRLRTSARELADTAPAGAVRRTADGRLALRSPACTGDRLPLAACVVPLPNRTAEELTVQRLPATVALVRLLQFPRVVGWVEPASAATEFQAVADLVERVPVFHASIPWGPPFRPDLASGLLKAVAEPVQR